MLMGDGNSFPFVCAVVTMSYNERGASKTF